MSNFDTYLDDLQAALGAFSPAERAEIMAEIQGHIEDGLEDPGMGLLLAERKQKMEAELGSPKELANGLYESHWRRRWLNILLAILALLPLPMIFMLRVVAMVGMVTYNLGNLDLQLQTAAMVCVPLYFGMVYVGHRLKSPILTIWWLSWTVLHLGYYFCLSLVLKSSMWLIVLWAGPLLVGVVLFGQWLWKVRQTGLLIALAMLPIMLSAAQLGLLLIKVYAGFSPVMYGERDWWISMFGAPFFICIIATLFLLPRQQWRWISFISSVIIYMVAAAIIWQPLPFLYIVILWIGLGLPIVIGLLLEYHYLRRNPFLAGG
jgi:hypothetical protein